MKSLRDEMEIVNAYELVGTYRAAAALCGTTAKTVKRVLERRVTGQVGRRPVSSRERNTAAVVQLIEQSVRNNLSARFYPSGHMVYLDGGSRTALKADVAKMYDAIGNDAPAMARVRMLQQRHRDN